MRISVISLRTVLINLQPFTGFTMQYRIFKISCSGDPDAEESLNLFLRAHRVVSVSKELVQSSDGGAWCFCVEYLSGTENQGGNRALPPRGDRVDYKEVLSDADFALYVKLREVRKAAAQREAVPVFAVCTNEQMSLMAKNRSKSLGELKEIPGFGEAKASKFGADFLKVIRQHAETPSAGFSDSGEAGCGGPEI